MPLYFSNRIAVVGIIGLLCVAIFAIDLIIPLGVALAVPYIFPLLMTMRLPGIKITVWTGVVCSGLTFVGLYFSPEESLLWQVLANRALALFVIWLTVWFIITRKHSENNMEKIIEERTSALQFSEEKFSKSLHAIPDAITISSLKDGIIIDTSESVKELVGYSREELIGKTTLELDLWADKEKRKRFFKELSEVGTIRNFEGDFRTRSGQIRNVEISAEIFEIENKQYFVGATRDITERKQIEEELSASERRFRGVFEYSPIGMLLINKDGKTLTVNDAILDMSGYTMEEIIGKAYKDLTHPDDLEVSIRYFQKLVSGEIDDYRLEKRYLHKDGHTVYTILYGYLVRDEQNNPQYMVAHIEDITERKQAEGKLHESEEKYRLLVETMREGLAITGNDEKLSYVNRGLCKMMSATPEEMIGHPPAEFVDEENLKILQNRFEERRRGLHEPYEITWTALDNRRVATIVTPAPLFDSEGKSIGSFATVTDITERKQVEVNLRKLTNKMQLVREEERTKISHELHDQLGQSLTFLKMDMAGMIENFTPEQKNLRDRARDNLILMDETLEAVRRISRDLRPAMLDELGLEAAIEYQVEEFNQHMGKTCPCELEVNAKDIGLDNMRDTVVFRVLQESLTNVVRHAQADRVKVSLSTLDSQLVLCVEDNGTGITKEVLDRTDSLGVVGMRERCDAIGGTFEIAAIDGGGTRVLCSVPLSSTA